MRVVFEQIGISDRGDRLRLGTKRHSGFGFQRLVKPLIETATFGSSAFVFIHDLHPVILNDVVDALFEKRVSFERSLKKGNEMIVLFAVKHEAIRKTVDLLGGLPVSLLQFFVFVSPVVGKKTRNQSRLRSLMADKAAIGIAFRAESTGFAMIIG